MCAWLPVAAVATPAEDALAAEAREVKAAYLYKFAGYVEWPPGSFARRDSPIVFGVAEDDPLREVLDRMIRDETVGGRRLVVRRVQAGDPLSGIHILFVGQAQGGEQARIMQAAEGHPILLVSDSTRVRALGSMVDLVVVDDRLRFDVARGTAARSRLEVSALLLSAARRVDRGSF